MGWLLLALVIWLLAGFPIGPILVVGLIIIAIWVLAFIFSLIYDITRN